MGTEIHRNLVTIRRISEILEHTNADALEICVIGGWQVVTQKGLHKAGDLVVYCEIDSFLPEIPAFEFLRERCYREMADGSRGFRVKSIRLRSEISQGVIIKLADIFTDLSLDSDELRGSINSL